MDAGYDAEDIHRLIREAIHVHSEIPVLVRTRKHIGGKYWGLKHRSSDSSGYPRKNLAETVYLVGRRRFGESRKAWQYRNQVKEITVQT